MSELELWLAWMRRHDLWPCLTAEEAELRRDQFQKGETPWESAEAVSNSTWGNREYRPKAKKTLEAWT